MAFFMSVSNGLQQFAQEIQSALSPNVLRDLARDVGFVQRTSKYQAKDLVALCVWVSQNVAMTSLTQLSSCLEASTEVLISPEGLNQRFNKAAVQFLQHLLAELLNQKLTSSMPISYPYTSVFKRIRILDSTAFQLPDTFSSIYPGAGGCSHTAGVKIQLEYDLLSGQFLLVLALEICVESYLDSLVIHWLVHVQLGFYHPVLNDLLQFPFLCIPLPEYKSGY